MRVFLLLNIMLILPMSMGNANCSVIPECLAGLCLRVENLDDLPGEDRIRKLIGSSREVERSIPHRMSSCHLISTPMYKGIYVNLIYINVESIWRLVTINIALQKLCDNPEALSVNFEFLTEKKIGLSSSQKNVLAAYGEPKYFLRPPPTGLIESYFPYASQLSADTVIQYVAGGDELLTTRFFLLNDEVIGVSLSADV